MTPKGLPQIENRGKGSKGNMFPLETGTSRVGRMNRRLTDQHIRATCRELLAGEGRPSGRELRRELRHRFGAVGRTARVFKIWREESDTAVLPHNEMPGDLAELERRLRIAEEAAAQNLARAERAEYRERAHQDKWAMEIDRLRTQLNAQPNYAAEVRALQEQVVRLTVELHVVRSALTKLTIEGGGQ